MKFGLVLGVLCLLAPAQDLKDLKRDFRKAIIEEKADQVASFADKIAALNTPDAVKALTWGYDYCAQKIRSLWGRRRPLQAKVDGSGHLITEWDKVARVVEENNDVIPGHLLQEYLDGRKKRDLYYGMVNAVGEVDREISRIDALKALIVAALSKVGSDSAVEGLIEKLGKSKSWTTRAAVAEVLGGLNHPAALPALRNHMLEGDSDVGVLVAVIDALAKKAPWDPETIRATAQQLDSKFWQVRYSATRALGSSAAPAAIDPLIRAFGKADGRLKQDIHGALVLLTGVDKGMKADSWKSWFEANRAQLLGGKYEPRPGESVAGKGHSTGIKFYGIPVKSKNVVFIIDRSGSMKEPGAFNEEELKYIGTGESRESNSALKNLKPEGERKIDIARYQLKKVLWMLPTGTMFNIIFFNQDFNIMNSRMVKLNDKSRKQAFDFIDPLDPTGATNIWSALTEAMKFCASPGPDGKLKADGADTIFLLTDGLPFPPGKVTGPPEILSGFKEWNRQRKIVIHTIFVAAEGTTDWEQGESFLKQLAKENKGMFKGGRDTIWKKEVAGKKP